MSANNIKEMLKQGGLIMKLVPLGDRVVLKQIVAEETTKSGIVLPGQSNEKPQQAEVVAVGPGGTVDGKEVKMIAEYQARTRSGAFVEQFALCVSINFNIDNNGGVFYIGTTYSSSTDLFNWQGYGASLSTTAEGISVFSSTSYLNFRVSDQGNCLVKVPVSFKGSYNFKDNMGTYSFTLSKAAN